MKIAWYGGSTRRVEAVAGAGHWYKAGAGLVPVRWVFVHDRDGTHRDEYFYSTDPHLGAQAIIKAYMGRWDIETTFQETRSELHVETTRGRSHATVLRATPCLFGLYSVVALLYADLPRGRRVGGVSWPGKSVVTFSDAMAAVRRWIWSEGVFSHLPGGVSVEKLPPPIREVLYTALAPAA